MPKYITAISLIAVFIALVAYALWASTQALEFSTDAFGPTYTDTTGDDTDSALFYAKFSVCPLELSLDSTRFWPDDSVWWDLHIDLGLYGEQYAIWRDTCGFVNSGCVVTNIRLCVIDSFSPWYTTSDPPYEAGLAKFNLWALVMGNIHHPPDSTWLSFWPMGDTGSCLLDTCPCDSLDYITVSRFYNPALDPSGLVPPMDDTGMNLYPGKKFWIYLMFQSPVNYHAPPDSIGYLILKVNAEAVGE